MPIEVDLPDGSVAEFPDGTSHDVMKAAIAKRFPPQASKPVDSMGEPVVPPAAGAVPWTAEQNAALEQQRADEQAKFDASRTLGKRIEDTATFALSTPVRALTKGQYGLGDLYGLANERVGRETAQSEADFARANQGQNAFETLNPMDIPSLATMEHAGGIAPGIPMLSTMGYLPMGATNTAIAAAKQLPGEAKALLKDERGAGPIPGAGGPKAPPPGAPPPSGPTLPPQPPAGPMGIPNRAETFAAQERLKQGLGVEVPISAATVGPRWKQKVAAGLRSVPGVGEPVEMAYEKGVAKMGEATKAAGKTLGEAKGAESVGEAVRGTSLDWIRKNSKDYLKEKYDAVANSVDQGLSRPLISTEQVAKQLNKEMAATTVRDAVPALKLVEEALSRPEGLNAAGVQKLRTAIGQRIDAAKSIPDPAEASYKRLYKALDQDLQATLKAAGGDKALRAWQLANREAKIVAGKRQRLAKVIGVKEDALSDKQIYDKLYRASTEGGANTKALLQVKEIVGDKKWGDFAAQILDTMGMDPKRGVFSEERFLTAYGKMSERAKAINFGPAKQHLDDIAALARKYGTVSQWFNRSNTGLVNRVVQVIQNPVAAGTHAALALTNPANAITFAAQAAGTAAGRSLAWSLSKPIQAKSASTVLKSYEKVYLARMAKASAGTIARHEANLAATIRTVSMQLAQETGGNADQIAEALRKATSGTPDQP